jgi:hypothetical protein
MTVAAKVAQTNINNRIWLLIRNIEFFIVSTSIA